eukprot:CAMPEP_0204515180 /NCGR_PEP_ID=MMETSP0661-20131031/2482_1 /ASSEMBLY_ACC=CAM_ASM_000606 /TAXON_ID=109239 /ORGANISM="Alexandrium margalefi, Strain AMGDE01CS-322" /LENGTH=184 /DNA_ID=CAMNT_0051520479 /DNA_START=81 /DNA_END=635 /DNA_ORIENTATION=+
MSPQPSTRAPAAALALLLLAAGASAMTFPKRLHTEAKQAMQLQGGGSGQALPQEGAKKEEGAKAEGASVAAAASAKVAEGAKAEGAAVAAAASAKVAEGAKTAMGTAPPREKLQMNAARQTEAPLQPAVPEEVLEEEEMAPPATSLLQESLQLERKKSTKMVCDERGCTRVLATEPGRPKHDEF